MTFHISDRYKFFLLLFTLALLISAPIGYSHTYIRTTNALTDFNQHMLWAISLDQNGSGSIPPYILAHSGWQILLIFLTRLFGISFNFAGFLSVLFLSGITVLILSWWYSPVLFKADQPLWKSAAATLGVSIAAPVSMLWGLDHLMYLGYIGITTYHNPTMILLKPFAFLQFIYAYHCFYNDHSLKKWQVVAGSLISILATFIKPSFAICILPSLGIIVVIRLIQKKYVNLSKLFFGIGLPTLLVLIWQFLLSYYENETGAIKYLPIAVMSAYSGYLGLKFFLSILFPLAVLIAFFKQAITDIRIVLVWSIFFFGTIFTYFLAESGPRFVDGNFGWSGEIALVLLFAVSTLFFLEISPKTRILKWGLTLTWLLHIMFGIFYYLLCVFNYSYH
jgi:hypothetical protein